MLMVLMGDDPDRDLVEQLRSARTGDLRAFEAMVMKYQKWLIANCRHLTGEPNVAEDLAQEIFVKVYFGLNGYEGRSSFRRWLQAIKVKHCLTYMKKERKRKFIGIDEEGFQEMTQLTTLPEAQRVLDEADDRERIGFILSGMSETLRVPLILCDMDELSYDEIADALGVSLSATKMRIARARQEFRERYQRMLHGMKQRTVGYA